MYSEYLIVGATGGTGTHIVNDLINQGKNVTLIVRDKTKAKEIFKENYEKIKEVLEAQLGIGYVLKNEQIKSAFQKCDCIISTIGSNTHSNPKINEYNSIKELIQLAEGENSKIKKFVFVTSLYITRPYTFVAYLLNNIIPFVLGWKSLAENKLRLSKLNYMIVRPGGLTNEVKNESNLIN